MTQPAQPGISRRQATLAVAATCALGALSGCKSATPCQAQQCTQSTPMKGIPVTMDNAKFYKDGKFDAAAAKAAYFEMMKNVGAPIYKRYTEDESFLWCVDFAQGDFAKLGMGGLFWVNNEKKGYFGHEIFLLPGQSIAEHCHKPTAHPEKHESWQVRYGSVYGFSEIGEPNLDKYPDVVKLLSEKQKKVLVSKHVELWEADGSVYPLPQDGTWHFMMGGPKGAVVTEYANFHDGAGLRFTVPGVAF